MTTYGAQRIKQASRHSNRHDAAQLPHGQRQLLETRSRRHDLVRRAVQLPLQGRSFLLPSDSDGFASRGGASAIAVALWLGFTFNLIVIVSYLVVTALFYDLFRPVSRRLSLQAALFSVVGCAVQAAALVFYAAPWVVLSGSKYLASFSEAAQLRHGLSSMRQ